jgi:RNA polymerase sigma factor (sigma-70 family)
LGVAASPQNRCAEGVPYLNEMPLWRNLTDENRARLIEQYQPLVYHIYGQLAYKPDCEHVDLISEGTLGLIEAVDAFDCERGVTFKTFAYLRIKGKMLDYLRRRSVLIRSEEITALEQFKRTFAVCGSSAARTVDAILLAKSLLPQLTSSERRIIELLYFHGLSQEEAARRLCCTRPNVSILRKRALARMRRLLAESSDSRRLAFDL